LKRRLYNVEIISDCAGTKQRQFNGLLSGTIQPSWYQKGTINLDFTEARDGGWQWRHLDHMQIATSLQTDAYTPPLKFFTGRMPFLPLDQQRQSTEGIDCAVNLGNRPGCLLLIKR